MDLVVFSAREILVVLRALRAAAGASGAFSQHEADLIEAFASLHGVTVNAHELSPIAPAEVARVVTEAHQRKRLVQLAIVTTLVEGAPGPEAGKAIAELARALQVDDVGVETLRDLASGHALLARIDMMRRMRGFLMRRAETLPNLFKTALPVLLGLENRTLAAKYQALADYAPGSLGRALYQHYREHGFHFPGEVGGIPEWVVFHDVGHVLAGYDVDPQGEIQQAAFQAGFIKQDGFMFLLFGILQFHVGMRLTPLARAERGFFDVKRVIAAAARGAACTMDLSDGFDLFGHAHESLDDLRARWGVTALSA
ncbi:MAG TPA: hypothetical protein VJV79_12840 [Polyangiaceae bacterium]|nr:hypothetical protein [Polyangiaceae bacterium]